MNPLALLLGLGAVGAYLLLSNSAPKQTTTTIKTPVGKATVKQTPTGTTVTLPTSVPTVLTSSGNQRDDSIGVTYDEQTFLNDATPDQVYAAGIASNHLGFIIAAATFLAVHGDVRAAELTQRQADWLDTGGPS